MINTTLTPADVAIRAERSSGPAGATAAIHGEFVAKPLVFLTNFNGNFLLPNESVGDYLMKSKYG